MYCSVLRPLRELMSENQSNEEGLVFTDNSIVDGGADLSMYATGGVPATGTVLKFCYTYAIISLILTEQAAYNLLSCRRRYLNYSEQCTSGFQITVG